MRSCLSFLVVQYMRAGNSPQKACEMGIAHMKDVLELDEIASGGRYVSSLSTDASVRICLVE